MFECNCPPNDCAGRVAAYLGGDRSAGDELVQKFTPLVRAVVARVLGPHRREDWDDACQTIFLRLFRNLEQWGHRCPFCKWLAVVAARRAIDLSRVPLHPETSLASEIAAPQPATPDAETIERIHRLVQQFPPQWREVWYLWLAGTSREEMARRSGKSLRTIQYWLAEMLDYLREQLRSE
ncbi:MAG: sigma-70 family RNA polymerase sigma factor [Gemmataceae bacterium]